MVRLFMTLLLFVGLTAGAQATTIIYQNDFNGTLPPQTKLNYETDNSGNKVPWAFTFSSIHKRSGTHSLRVENRGHVGTSEDGGKRRREFEPRLSLLGENRVRFLEDVHTWAGFSLMLDPNWDTSVAKSDLGSEIIILQTIHRAGPGASTGIEMLWLLRGDRRLRIQQRWDDGKGNAGRRSADAAITLEPGRWYDIVYHKYRKMDDTGRHRLWLDGKLVMDVTGPNMIVDGDGGGANLKWGAYWGTDNRDSTYVLYFDNMKVARGTFTDGYNLVNPAAGSVPQAPAKPSLVRH